MFTLLNFIRMNSFSILMDPVHFTTGLFFLVSSSSHFEGSFSLSLPLDAWSSLGLGLDGCNPLPRMKSRALTDSAIIV